VLRVIWDLDELLPRNMAPNMSINTTTPTTQTQGAVYHIAGSGAVTAVELLVVVWVSDVVELLSCAKVHNEENSIKASNGNVNRVVFVVFFISEVFVFYILLKMVPISGIPGNGCEITWATWLLLCFQFVVLFRKI